MNVRQLQIFLHPSKGGFDTGDTYHSCQNTFQLVSQGISGIGSIPNTAVKLILGIFSIPDILFHIIQLTFSPCQFVTGILNG